MKFLKAYDNEEQSREKSSRRTDQTVIGALYAVTANPNKRRYASCRLVNAIVRLNGFLLSLLQNAIPSKDLILLYF
ncbi:MAG: hypothetical protein V2B20_24840 [Pseudomonadota bacterium]